MADISDAQAGELHYSTPDYGKTGTADFWRGSFGDAYTKRNRVDFTKRIPFWRDIIAATGARNILEVGCNAGWNLSALRMVMPTPSTFLSGVEINELAADQARKLGFSVGQSINQKSRYDLTFTAGVLIHIAPQDLAKFMQDIIAVSRKYVLAVEYFSEQEEEIEYRGHAGKLWRRDYGILYENMGLRCVHIGIVDKDDGFDDCRWWLMEKQ